MAKYQPSQRNDTSSRIVAPIRKDVDAREPHSSRHSRFGVLSTSNLPPGHARQESSVSHADASNDSSCLRFPPGLASECFAAAGRFLERACHRYEKRSPSLYPRVLCARRAPARAAAKVHSVG
eukprot:scaffold3719_cov247-Pinguiococcus_pyrenoidosus.AAC.14